jgi:hypothetical protein
VNLVSSLPLRSHCLLACALSHPLVIWYPTVYHDETYFVVVDPLRQPLASKSDRRPVGTLHNSLIPLLLLPLCQQSYPLTKQSDKFFFFLFFPSRHKPGQDNGSPNHCRRPLPSRAPRPYLLASHHVTTSTLSTLHRPRSPRPTATTPTMSPPP